MPTRKEVSKIKADYIIKRESVIKSKISLQQEQLYSELIDVFLQAYKQDPARVKGGDAPDANTLINNLEKRIEKFGLDASPDTLRDYVNSASTLGDLTMMYYSTMFDDNAKLEEIKQKTVEVINKKLGVNADGTIKTGGFIDKMIADKGIQKKIIAESRKAITNGYDLQTLKSKLKTIIVGSPEQNGVIQQHYNTYSKDLLNSVSNNYSNMFAKDLDLQHAIYSGGLIKTSHPICIQNNGKIFTRDQIEALKEDPRIVKMYGDHIADYDPFQLPGGYGCLHSWDWITQDLAQGQTREQNAKATERNAAFKKRNDL